MEAAYNFTDAVIENKMYVIEKSNFGKIYYIEVEYRKSKTCIALYDIENKIFIERMPIHDTQQQMLKAECVKLDKELEAAELREKELKEEFEAWRKNNGK